MTRVVLHLITGLNVGGAERMLHKLAAHSDRTEFKLHVISLLPGGKIADDLKACGVSVSDLGVRGPFSGPKGLLRLYRHLQVIQPDVIQGWMYHGNFVAWMAYWMCRQKVPLVWNIRHSLHGLSGEKRLTKGLIRLCARISGSAAKILYNSQTSRLHHEALGYHPDSAITIPNGFDTETFCPDNNAKSALCKQLGVRDDVRLVGLIARFDPLKDHRNFIAAAALVHQACPSVHFVLVGRQVDRENEYLVSLVDSFGLGGCLHLLGERHDIPAIMAALDVAVSSSRSEAFANAIGEVMSCGIPCVATNVGDSAYLLGHCGEVVPPEDPDALAMAISRLLSMPEKDRLLLGKQARQRIIDSFSIKAVTLRYERVYSEIVAKKNKTL